VFLWRWFLANTLLSGLAALAWLILRSGPKPNRFVYPCQQAAVSTASLAFGAPVVAAILAARRRSWLLLRRRGVLAAAGFGLALTVGLRVVLPLAAEDALPALAPAEDYRARIYHVADCPEDPAGEHFLGLNNLLVTMGRDGLKFYRSEAVSPLAGPEGIIAPHDVVVVKINYQWDQRGGTNTDVLKGLIRAILDHPDGFDGEVVVCENSQFNSINGFDRANNNAQDHSQSPHDVVAWFQSQGAVVSHFDWTAVRGVQVSEFSSGDMNSGYVVGSYDSRWRGKLSYPKFRSSAGTNISIRYGIWDAQAGAYDRGRLKFINVPVLKSHHATYGATVATKHYMGVVTDQFSTNSHSGIRYGIMGALMDHIQMPDLNIVDAVWINANPNSGPQTSYAGATRRDELVASLDPIALDRWAVCNILIPGFLSNGYTPPWPSPSADPDLPNSAFRTYLDASMNHLLSFGHQVTNLYEQMDLLQGAGGAGDFDGDGAVGLFDYQQFAACFTGPGGGPLEPSCAPGDFDGDDDIDCDDWSCFREVWTASEAVPDLPQCGVSSSPQSGGSSASARLGAISPNPMSDLATITWSMGARGNARLAIFDASGRMVRALFSGEAAAGWNSMSWNGRDDQGRRVARGSYYCRLDGDGGTGLRKIIVR